MRYAMIPSTTSSATHTTMTQTDFAFSTVPAASGQEFMDLLSEHFVIVLYKGTNHRTSVRVAHLGNPYYLMTPSLFVRHATQLFGKVFNHRTPPLMFRTCGVDSRVSKSQALQYWVDGPLANTGKRVFQQDEPALVAAIAEWHAKYGTTH